MTLPGTPRNSSFSSPYIGVCWHKVSKKWRAGITISSRCPLGFSTSKFKQLGYYVKESDAAKAYDAYIQWRQLDKPMNFTYDEEGTPS